MSREEYQIIIKYGKIERESINGRLYDESTASELDNITMETLRHAARTAIANSNANRRGLKLKLESWD